MKSSAYKIMNNNSIILSRGKKILLFLYELGKGKKKRFVYEDIVVGLFKKYPSDFHLKGYPEYPDSSDSSQRLLYEFKKRGYITVANKIFCLTDNGLDFVKGVLDSVSSNNTSEQSPERLSRATMVETDRIKNLEGFALFMGGEIDKLTESDFYNYLGVTARTSPTTFSGRMKNIEVVIKEIQKEDGITLFSKIVEYHEFLMSKHKDTLNFFLKK